MKPGKYLLASDGETTYTIVVGRSATEAENYAAKELADHLKLMTGAEFAVKSEDSAGGGPSILVGRSKRTAGVKNLGDEELLVRTVGPDVVLIGGGTRGTLYAVYSFLEDDLGCHWWTPTASTTPHKPTLTIGPIDRREKSFMEYRLPAFSGYMLDATYAIRNRVNAMQDNPSQEQDWPGGRFAWANRYCHSFATLVPGEKLMEHPDWCSKGTDPKQFQWTGQLCLTNPAVEDYVVEQLKQAFRANPEANIASVSQNDNMNYCKCERCEALAQKIGQSGLMVSFLNRIAAKLKPEFPNKILHTFAYQYTQAPPLDKSIRVDDNVVIQLTTEGVSHASPLNETALKNTLETWAKIAKRVYIWDYETNFLYHQAPIPNLISLGPNFNWFAKNHVRGMLIQGGSRVPGEFSDLRGWVAAKLMWNPKQDGGKLIDQFLKGYYGEAAAPFLREYIDLLQRSTVKEKWDMYVQVAELPSLDWRLILESERIFDKAEEAARGDAESLKRVRTARMQVDYMLILRREEYLREAKRAGQEWPTAYSPDVRARAFLAIGEESGLAAQCSEYDRLQQFPLGERGGTWADLRERCNSVMMPESMKVRASILSSAAAKACEMMHLEQAESYIKFLQDAIKAGGMKVRDGVDEVTCSRMNGHQPGRFEDWSSIPETGRLSRTLTDQADLSGVFKLGWDADNVYVLADVKDDAFVPDCSRYWQGDGLEVYFNMLDDDGIAQPNTYGPDDFHFGISADACVYDYDSTSMGNALGLGKVAGMVAKHKRTENGYLLEVATPWKSMFLKNAEPGYTFGFTIALDDLDTAGKWLKTHILWKGQTAYINTQGWGRARLKEQ